VKRFKNKTILITGCSNGIGLAGAKRLVEEGARLIITGQHLKQAREALGKDVLIITDNVEDRQSAERLASIVKQNGSLDGLWLNAAYALGGDINTMSKQMINQLFAVNVVAPILQMGTLSSLIKNGGAVLATSSSVVYDGQSSVSVYAASKAAILAAARCWATELASRNIRVNSLVPGPIATNHRFSLPEELRKQCEDDLAKTVWLKQIGNPEEAAAIAAFLLSDEASYVTGSAYVVDGGLLMM